MGYKCKKCGTNNGITYYVGKVCKRCEEPIILKIPKNYSQNTGSRKVAE